MENLESAVLRGDEASKDLAEMLYLQDEIERIQNGKQVGNEGIQLSAFQAIERVSKERGTISDRVQDLMNAGKLPKQGTGNEVQQKMERMIEILKACFEEWTCMFKESQYEISDELFEKIDDAFPGLNSKAHIISLSTKGIVITDLAGNELQTFGLYDFYEGFIAGENIL